MAKKDPPPVPKKTSAPVSPVQSSASFGFGTDDFSAPSDFGAPSDFSAPSNFSSDFSDAPAFDVPQSAFDTAPSSFEPAPATTSAVATPTEPTPAQPSFSANFDSFGTDSFGSSSFDFGAPATASPSQAPAKVTPAVPPKPPAKKPVEEDPFSFTSDLSSSAVNDAPDDFGSSSSASSGFGTFGSHTGFGDSSFSFDSFGSSAPATTSAPPPVPVKPAAVSGQPSFDSSFDFPSNLAEFDTGKDSFG